jgi:nucleolar GTP-binding protein
VTKAGALFQTMSNFTEAGIAAVKSTACDALLAKRIEVKLKAHKVDSVVNRLTVTAPKPRDGKVREPSIPPSVLAARAAAASSSSSSGGAAAASSSSGGAAGSSSSSSASLSVGGGGLGDGEEAMAVDGAASGYAPVVRKWLERDRERAAGGPGVYKVDTSRYYIMREEDWKTDLIPELVDGKNIADFYDPDIDERLQALEAEEEALLAAEAEADAARAEAEESEDEEASAEQRALLDVIRGKKKVLVKAHQRDRGKNRASLPRTAGLLSAADAKAHFTGLGLDASAAAAVVASASGERKGDRVTGHKRGRSPARRGGVDADGDVAMGGEGSAAASAASSGVRPSSAKRVRPRSSSEPHGAAGEAPRDRSHSRARSVSRGPSRDVAGFASNAAAAKKSKKIARKVNDNTFKGTAGESDRRIGAKLPKHLYSGKRGIGKTDRR